MRYLAPAILWCISAFAQSPVPAAAADSSSSVTPKHKCSIEGTVVNSVTGEPVKKARVHLGSLGAPRSIPYAATTDASGHFLLIELDAGRYHLEAFREGYSNPSFTSVRTYTLEPGQELKDIVLKLSPVGVVSGRILDEDGDPVSNVKVECVKFRYLDGVRQLIGEGQATTNDLGDFRLSVSTAGKYEIRATPPGTETYGVHERPIGQVNGKPLQAEQEYVPTYYPRSANPSTASPIEVAPGTQISGVNINLIRAATARIKGRVKAEAALILEQTAIELDGWNVERMYANVDSKGGFQFNGVLPGSYFLRAVGDKGYGARVPVDIGDQNIEGIELTLQPPATIQGRVVFEEKGELKGMVPALVIASPTGMEGKWVHVKDDLTFKVDGLIAGSYRVALGGGLPNTYIKRVRLGDQDVPETGFNVIPGALELTVFLSPDAGVVEGSVKNAKDEPAIGATVTLIPEATRRTRRHKITTTDQNGHFKIEGIFPGEYKIYAWEQIEDGAYEDPDFVKPHESDGEKVSIKESGHETMQLKVIPAETTGKE